MKYVLEINSASKSIERMKKYIYTYFEKCIVVYLDNEFARIEVNRETKYNFDEIASGKALIFSDAIKKAMLLHYLIYSRALHLSQLSIWRGTRKKEYFPGDAGFSVVYSLAGDNLWPCFPDAWQDDETLSVILSTKKNDQDSRFCSLVALICAKSTNYESERFIHLWMGFNGMYTYFSNLVQSKHKQERIQLEWFLNAHNWGKEHINRKYANEIGINITKILLNYSSDEIDWYYLNNDPRGIELSREIVSTVESIIKHKYETSAYGYLLVDYGYYFRCNLIHANKPLPLFCYSSEDELKCLHIVNHLLEEYIENNLCLWFKKSYLDDRLKPLASTFLPNS